MILVFVTLCFLGAFVFLFWVLSIDALLRKIYAQQRDLWVSLGSPSGWFWSAPGTKWFQGAAARQKFILSVSTYKPTWVQAHPAFTQDWRRISVLNIVCIMIGIIVVVCGIQVDLSELPH